MVIENRDCDGKGGSKENAQATSLGIGRTAVPFTENKENKKLIVSEKKISLMHFCAYSI